MARKLDIEMLWQTSGVGRRHRDHMRTLDHTGLWGQTCERVLSYMGRGCIVGMCGNRGNGKSQIGAVAIWRHLEDYGDQHRATSAPPRMARAMEVFLDIRAAFRPAATQCERDALQPYVRASLLVLDELHERGETAWENRLLAYIVDTRYAEMRDTVLISNDKPADFAAQIGVSIVDRMRETGGIIECTWPSFRAQRSAPWACSTSKGENA